MSRKSPLRVQIVLFDGAEDQDFTGPFEVFSGVKYIPGHEDAAHVTYVVLDKARTVTTAYGTKIEVASVFKPKDADIILVPGGGWHPGITGPGVTAEIDHKVMPDTLKSAAHQGATIASVCTGAMLLSAAGITERRPCTTHHSAKKALADAGGLAKDARVVDDGKLITSGGVTSGIDLALWLVQREVGSDVAVQLETLLEYELRGTVWRRA